MPKLQMQFKGISCTFDDSSMQWMCKSARIMLICKRRVNKICTIDKLVTLMILVDPL